jgi:BMFP domain-containing protein YqiC
MTVEVLSRELEEALRSPTEHGRQEAIVHVLARAIREVAALQGRVNELEQRLNAISDMPAPVEKD